MPQFTACRNGVDVSQVSDQRPEIPRRGDDYTAESTVTYPDGSVWKAVDMFHFRAGKIIQQTSYYAPTLEPAEWRARWVERF